MCGININDSPLFAFDIFAAIVKPSTRADTNVNDLIVMFAVVCFLLVAALGYLIFILCKYIYTHARMGVSNCIDAQQCS